MGWLPAVLRALSAIRLRPAISISQFVILSESAPADDSKDLWPLFGETVLLRIAGKPFSGI